MVLTVSFDLTFSQSFCQLPQHYIWDWRGSLIVSLFIHGSKEESLFSIVLITQTFMFRWQLIILTSSAGWQTSIIYSPNLKLFGSITISIVSQVVLFRLLVVVNNIRFFPNSLQPLMMLKCSATFCFYILNNSYMVI